MVFHTASRRIDTGSIKVCAKVSGYGGAESKKLYIDEVEEWVEETKMRQTFQYILGKGNDIFKRLHNDKVKYDFSVSTQPNI